MSVRYLLAFAAISITTAPAAAHDLQAAVRVEADHIRVDAFFKTLSDESPAEQVAVTLYDAAGGIVAAGRADDRGVWTCPRPGAGDYVVVVEEAGHRAEVKVLVSGAVTPTTTYHRRPRLDPRLGLAVGLGLIVVITLALRRRPRAA